MSSEATNPTTEVPAHVRILVEEAWHRQEVIHKFLKDNPVNPMSAWSNQSLGLGLLSYSMCVFKILGIDRADFLTLCAAFYDNIMITMGQESSDGTTTQETKE